MVIVNIYVLQALMSDRHPNLDNKILWKKFVNNVYWLISIHSGYF